LQPSISLGRIFGIPVGVHSSWFLVFVLVTGTLALNYLPLSHPGWPWAAYWSVAVVTSLLFFVSVLAHEMAHSLVAIRLGVPVKSITLFIFGGVAQISREAPRPSAEFIITAAGPITSFAIALLFGAVFFLTGRTNRYVAAAAEWLGIVNMSVAVFNLIPGFPLDGGRILRSLLWAFTGDYRRASYIATWSGRLVGYLFIFGGVVAAMTGSLISGIWIALIGWFLENAASESYRQIAVRDALAGVTVRQIMVPDVPAVSLNASLKDLVYRYVLGTGRRCFLVVADTRLLGLVTLQEIKQVPQEEWETTTVEKVMVPSHRLRVVTPQDSAMVALQIMDEQDVAQLPVVDDGRVVGLVGRDGILRLMRARAELGI
jgi:Zn-dependent protease/CBS domain-containing protein